MTNNATRMLAILVFAWFLVISHPARAEAGWTGPVRVLELIPTARHYFEIHLAVDDNPGGCRADDWFYLNYDTRGADQMFDLFVESLKSKLRLRVYVTGLCNLNGYAEISAVGASAN